MTSTPSVLATNDDLPICTNRSVHSGKVRSVYWLTPHDSQRLIASQGYAVAEDAELAVMVISDRISAFDCIWHGQSGLQGVPGKGAALNAIANHWFGRFQEQGLGASHIVAVPHPLVWIVQRARPVMIEAIARQYITGSMWRAYQGASYDTERTFCGIALPQGLQANQRLPELLITPSTKGVLMGLQDVPAADDANISRHDIERHFQAFGFRSKADIERYETMLRQGFEVIAQDLAKQGQMLVDTKFEFGYVKDAQGNERLIYMDEVGTPDSSRIWNQQQWLAGQVVEKSKEGFRQFLLGYFDDPDILLNKARMAERQQLASEHALPQEALMDVAETYKEMAETITGMPLPSLERPRDQIIEALSELALIRT